MKNNIMIIVIVTLIAVFVIAAVIVASIVNSSNDIPIDNSSSVVSTSDHTSEIIDVQSGDNDNSIESAVESSFTNNESLNNNLVSSESVSEISQPVIESSEGVSQMSDNTEYDNADDIVVMAHSLIDTPFMENGENPSDGFDNSGFIYYVLRENGYITCPRIASEQARMGAKLSYDQLKPGDLVFFRAEDSNDAGYGGIYIGNDKMIACMMPGTYVKEVDISTNYYQSYFYCGVSLS